MKLKNKKTGEVVKIYPALNDETAIRFMAEGGKHYEYKSLAEFNKFWEDAPEEPKEYWIPMSDEPYPFVDNDWEKEGLATGLISLSKEENEIKREKLKAWQRLEDKVFRFRGWKTSHLNLGVANFFLPDAVDNIDAYRKDLDLLFGGDE